MYVPTSVIILQYFDKKKSFANGLAMCGSGKEIMITKITKMGQFK